MSDPYTKDGYKRFTLRMDKDLYKIVEQSAKDNKRSVSKEIEYRLEEYFKSHNDYKE